MKSPRVTVRGEVYCRKAWLALGMQRPTDPWAGSATRQLLESIESFRDSQGASSFGISEQAARRVAGGR